MTPEISSRVIVRNHHEMTLVDAHHGECVDRSFRQHAAHPPSAIARMHGEMVEIAPTAIGSAENRADHRWAVHDNEAQSGILREVGCDGSDSVGIAHDDAWR